MPVLTHPSTPTHPDSSQRYNGAFVIDMPDAAEDPSPGIEKECHGSCLKAFAAYEACAKRIEGKPDAHCTGQYLDYLHCIDEHSAGASPAPFATSP
jgi:ubiquinol-cytochrome c reductase subunit 6